MFFELGDEFGLDFSEAFWACGFEPEGEVGAGVGSADCSPRKCVEFYADTVDCYALVVGFVGEV